MKQINLTPKQYHAHKFEVGKLPDIANAGPLSASVLSDLRDPLKFVLKAPKEDTGEMQWGSLIDCLWTTPYLFNEEYVILPEDAPSRPQERFRSAKKPAPATIEAFAWWDRFDAANKGKASITAQEAEEAHAAVNMLNQHPIASAIHECSHKQVALMGENPLLPGTQAKCLLDLLPLSGEWSNCIPDLKTTNSTSENDLVKTMLKFDYLVKLAFYGILTEVAGFGERPEGRLIWQCSKWPYDVHVRKIERSDIAIGREIVLKRIERLKRINPVRISEQFDNEEKTTRLPGWFLQAYLEE